MEKPDLLDALRHYGADVQDHRVEQVVVCVNPDHDETRPSMTVNKVKGLFSCKACGFAGDAYTLIQKLEGTDSFAETLSASRRIFGVGGATTPAAGRLGLSGNRTGGYRPRFARRGLGG